MGSLEEDIEELRSRLERFDLKTELGAQPVSRPVNKVGAKPLATLGARSFVKLAPQPRTPHLPKPLSDHAVQPLFESGLELGEQPLSRPTTKPAVPADQPIIPTSLGEDIGGLRSRLERFDLTELGAQPVSRPVSKVGAKPLTTLGARSFVNLVPQPRTAHLPKPLSDNVVQPLFESGTELGEQPLSRPTHKPAVSADRSIIPTSLGDDIEDLRSRLERFDLKTELGAQPVSRPVNKVGAKPLATLGARSFIKLVPQPRTPHLPKPLSDHAVQPLFESGLELGEQPLSRPTTKPAVPADQPIIPTSLGEDIGGLRSRLERFDLTELGAQPVSRPVSKVGAKPLTTLGARSFVKLVPQPRTAHLPKPLSDNVVQPLFESGTELGEQPLSRPTHKPAVSADRSIVPTSLGDDIGGLRSRLERFDLTELGAQPLPRPVGKVGEKPLATLGAQSFVKLVPQPRTPHLPKPLSDHTVQPLFESGLELGEQPLSRPTTKPVVCAKPADQPIVQTSTGEDIGGLRSRLENFGLHSKLEAHSTPVSKVGAKHVTTLGASSFLKPVTQPRIQQLLKPLTDHAVQPLLKSGTELEEQPLQKLLTKPAVCAKPADQPLIPTSAETLLSSVHGRDRRNLRQIGKHDLQAAVKYGVKEYANRNRNTGEIRYKFTYANIVYITDETCKREITSWVEPIEIHEAYVTAEDVLIHHKLSQRFKVDPSLITSHTIFIVDQSASMGNHDVEQYKTRSDAVFGTLALDFVGKQIDGKHLAHTDVASLILMRNDSEIVIEREPLDNVFFNKLLKQMKQQPYSHGNYLPALQLGRNLLKRDQENSNGALALVFLSDGRPSDRYTYRCSPEALRAALKANIEDIASLVSDRLSFHAVGFASNVSQFEVLEFMTMCFKLGKCNASFQHMKGDMLSLSHTVSALSNSVTQSRTVMSEIGGVSYRTPRKFEKETRIESQENFLFPDPEKWDVYTMDECVITKFVWDEESKDWIKVDIPAKTNAIGIKRRSFAQGNERIVFMLREMSSHDQNQWTHGNQKTRFYGVRYVAKESKIVEDDNKKMAYHKRFCRIQMKCENTAKMFNSRVSELKRRHRYLVTAYITFLDCWVYVIKGSKNGDCIRRVLCEKYLDGTYKKWNSNNGYVEGGVLPLQFLLDQPKEPARLDAILEESSEEETSDCELNDLVSCLKYEVRVDDYPQAFSHFSYRYSRRKILVCDLQGVLDSTRSPPVFEMTDPVIHYAPKDNRRGHKFGRTDSGSKGIHQFFLTHKCNNVCKLLGITGFQPR